MQGLRIPGHSAAVKDSLFERGLVACTAGDDVVRNPSVSINAVRIDVVVTVVANAGDNFVTALAKCFR